MLLYSPGLLLRTSDVAVPYYILLLPVVASAVSALILTRAVAVLTLT
jgi:hypothetical protein